MSFVRWRHVGAVGVGPDAHDRSSRRAAAGTAATVALSPLSGDACVVGVVVAATTRGCGRGGRGGVVAADVGDGGASYRCGGGCATVDGAGVADTIRCAGGAGAGASVAVGVVDRSWAGPDRSGGQPVRRCGRGVCHGRRGDRCRVGDGPVGDGRGGDVGTVVVQHEFALSLAVDRVNAAALR